MSDITYALRIAREGGGTVIHRPHKPRVHKFHVGPIHSSVAGRTDHLPITVESGSYVIPADIISAFGEGNTIAGFKHARRVFGGMPRGQGQQPYNHEGGPYGGGAGPYGQNGKIPYGMARGGYADGGASTKPAAESEPEPAETRPAYYPAPETEDHNYADGGDAHDHEKGSVPIVAAGGEYVLSPSQVRRVGNGDLDTGHRVLDKFVKDTRAQLIKTLKKLPGPAKD